jgi:hypothetical protein
VRAELFAADGADHGFFNRPPFFQPALECMTAFLLDVLAPRMSGRAVGSQGVSGKGLGTGDGVAIHQE